MEAVGQEEALAVQPVCRSRRVCAAARELGVSVDEYRDVFGEARAEDGRVTSAELVGLLLALLPNLDRLSLQLRRPPRCHWPIPSTHQPLD